MACAEYGIQKDLQIPTRNQPLQLPLQQEPRRALKLTNFKPTGNTRNKAIAAELSTGLLLARPLCFAKLNYFLS
jgi:hypothetical protein